MKFFEKAGILLLALALSVAGCRGGTKLNRLPVHGRVTTAAGEKLKAGITFHPIGDHKGPDANGSVTDGEYKFDRNTGPTAGKCKVIVVARSADRNAMHMPPTARQPKTKVKNVWEFEVDVEDDGDYSYDFTVTN